MPEFDLILRGQDRGLDDKIVGQTRWPSGKTCVMSDLFGFSRDVVKERYAVRTPSGFVPSVLPGWTNAVCIVQISPTMGANFLPNGSSPSNRMAKAAATRGPSNMLFICFPAGVWQKSPVKNRRWLRHSSSSICHRKRTFNSRGLEKKQLLIFLKAFEPLVGEKRPGVVIGHEKKMPCKPFLGNADARLGVCYRAEPEFDPGGECLAY